MPQNRLKKFFPSLPAEDVAVVAISDLGSLSLRDAVPLNASVETAALVVARTTEGPEIHAQPPHKSLSV